MAIVTVVAVAKGGQQQPLPLPDTLSPQQLHEWVIQRARPGGGGFGFLRTAQRRQQSQQETFSPQLLSELFSQRCIPGSLEAVALGDSESAAALGASESAAVPGASESAAALGARASTSTDPASAEALHTFTLYSGTSRCFFRDNTTLTPLAAPVPVSLADPTRGPLGSRLYTLTTASAQVAESGQVVASSRVSASGTLSPDSSLAPPPRSPLAAASPQHELPSPCLLPRSLPSLPRSPALPYLPCVEGRERVAPHSSELPPTTAPLQTLHMDVWGPAPVGGTDQERYFLLFVDDYTNYTTVLPLWRKADVSGVSIPWIRATRRQLRKRFRRDFPVLRLHSNRGSEFSSGLLAEFCRDEGICQTFTLPASLLQNEIAELRYAAHHLNLWPRVSEPETSPTLQWTGKASNASVFRVWGALSLVCDAKASKLSSRTLRCVFLAFATDAPPWQFYHPRERRVFSSQDVTFDEYVCFYRLHPHASHPVPLAPLFLVPVPPPPVDPLPPHAPAPSAETAGAEPGGAETEGEGSVGAATGGAGSGCAASGGIATGGADCGGAASPSGDGAVGDPAGGLGAGQAPQPDLLETLSPEAIRAWIVWRGIPGGGGYGPAGAGATSRGGTVGAGGAGGTAGGAEGAASAGGTRVAAGAGGTRAASPGGAGGAARAGGAEATYPAGATGAGGAGAASTGGPAGAGGAGAVGTGGAGAAGVGGAGGAAGAGGTGAGGTGAASPRGARTGGSGAAGANDADDAGGARGATGGTGGAGAAGAASLGGARTRGAGDAGEGGAAGARGAGGATGAAGAGGAGGTAGASGAGAARARGVAGAGGATGVAGAGGAGAAGAGGAGAAGTTPRRPFFYPQRQSSLPPPDSVLRQVLSLPSSTGLTPPLLCPPTHQSQPQLLPGSLLPALAPRTKVTESLTERRELETHACTRVRARRVARPCPPAVPGSHSMALRPSSVPQHAVLPEPPASSLPHIPDPESDLAHAARPTVTCLLATVVTDPDFESTAPFALVTELVDFAARVCLAAALPRFASMLLCPEGDPDALDIPTLRSYAEAIAGEYSSQWHTAMVVEMAYWKSTGTYVYEVPPPWANIVDGMWIFRVKRSPGSPPAFKARYVAQGFSQRQGVDFFQTFSPTPKMTTLRVVLHVAGQRDYELHSLDFSTAFLQGSLHEEIWLRRPPGFTGSFPAGAQWSLRWPVYGLRLAPREWQEALRTTLAALGFAPSSAEPSLFLRTDTTLPPFYVLVYITRDRARRTITLTKSHMVHHVLQRFGFHFSSPQPTPLSTGHLLSAPPLDESVEPSGPYPELVGCLMYLMTCTRPDLAYPLSLLARYVAPGQHRKVHWDSAKRVLRYLCSTSGMGHVLGGQGSVVLTGHSDASWADDQATQRSSQDYTFSLGSGSVSWRSSRSSSMLGSSCEAEIYAGAMDAQELRWLTYLQTYLGERPRSPPHRVKHIALRYFLARELQQRVRQLCLSYVALRANTADVFTKALGSGDHQRFCTSLGLVPTLPHLLVA
ncbi:unnamed protein product [Closterium sp. NIES-53]